MTDHSLSAMSPGEEGGAPPMPWRAVRWAWLGYVALTTYFTWAVTTSGGNLGVSDWDPLLLFHTNVFRSVYEYGQLPFWNAWACGGNPLWQNPQVALLSPTYLLALIVPMPQAMKANLALHYLVGFAGMHALLTSVFRISCQPALLMLASLYVLAGGIALHLTVGHATFLPYFYLPWLVTFFVRGVESGERRFSVAAAIVVAAGVYAGGIHMTFMMAVALACFAAAAALFKRDTLPLAVLATTGLLAVLLAAPKLVPVAYFITDPRVVDIRLVHPNDVMSLDMLLDAFLNPFQYLNERFPGQNYGWHEYGNYIGSFGVLLILGALATTLADRPWQRRHWLGVSLAITTVVLFALTIGESGPWAPYNWLRRLPVVSQFRLPSRYTLVFLFFATATVGWVLRDQGLTRMASPSVRGLVAASMVLAACYLAYRNRVPLEIAFSLQPVAGDLRFLSRPPAPRIDPDTDGFSADAPMMRATHAGRAVLRCNDSLLLRGTVRPDQPVVFADGAQISRLSFTPNRIDFSAVTREGARVYLNQRYLRGWRGSQGDLEVDPTSELAFMTLGPGAAGRFSFRFVPPGLWGGAGLFALGLGGALAIGRRPRSPAMKRRTAP